MSKREIVLNALFERLSTLDVSVKRKYNKNGYEKALAKIDKMDTEDVKSYIKKLIKDDMILGIQIIKNSH